MSLKKLVNEITTPILKEMNITGADGVIKGGSQHSKIKKMKKKGHTSVPYGSGYKKVNESEVKKIHSLLQKYGNSSQEASNIIKKHYKRVVKKFKGQTARDKTMALMGLALLGESMTKSQIKTMRDKFKKTGELPPHLKKFAKAKKEFEKKFKVKNVIVPGLEWMSDLKEQRSEIKKTIGVFGGRFQPFHSGHLATYKWLASQVDEAYITTSNIKKPPRHPMNFKEKVRHMVKVGIPKNRIIQEKTPYVATNLLKKFNPKTTAVVYAFGEKDAGRLKGGTKKSGGKTYYQDYKKSRGDIRGYEEHGYFVTAPQFGNISGTKTRDMLGNPNVSDKEKAKFFKKTFGYLGSSKICL